MKKQLNFLPALPKNFDAAKAGACFKKLARASITREQFAHMITASSIASSQIEGNSLDLNSYFILKQQEPKNREVIEIDDLIAACQFAKKTPLTEKNLLAAHKMLSSHFKNISATQKGKYRTVQVGIRGWSGLIYLAVEPQFVQQEMKKLLADINILLAAKLTFRETIYYAAVIHFMFAKIHPFVDGNGRAARLLEKWFLAEKSGETAWAIPSEAFYWKHRSRYYEKLNIGVNYYETLERIDKLKFHHLLPEAICFTP